MLDNNWWSNVKKKLHGKTVLKTENQIPIGSVPPYLSPLYFLSLYRCLSACLCMVIDSFISLVYPQWVSACVCLCLCGSLCLFLMSTSLWTTSKQLRLANPATAEQCFNSPVLRNRTVTHDLGSVEFYSR